MHNLDEPFAVGDESEESETDDRDELGQERPWERKDYGESSSKQRTPEYGSLNEERNVWGDGGK